MSATDAADEAFRAEVRDFLRTHLPGDMAQRGRTAVHPTREDMLGITALLARKGWSVPHWPKEHGGPGWSPLRRQLFEEELMMAGAPPNNIQGVSLVGPVIYTWGTQAQRHRFLPPIREGRVFWAQGFSEPNSGSDLASLRTRAVRDGDHYVVDGQKIWTSQAMLADWLFCLVRTDPHAQAQRGISFLLIPLDLPGITVRPIRSIDEGESLCEVFFESVRVPVDHLVGEEGRGWDYAKFLLGNERVATAEVPRNKRNLAALFDMAARARRGGVPMSEDPVFRERITRAEIDLLALEAAAVATLQSDDASALTPSALKLQGCELLQRILGLQVETLGAHGAAFYPHEVFHDEDAPRPGPAWAPGITAEFMFRRAATIYGGSDEVQKNIIAKLLFGGQRPAPAALTDEQSMLRQSAERFAAGCRDGAARRARLAGGAAAARDGWKRLADTGFLALGVDESLGGMGGTARELAVLFDAFGRGLAPDPLAGCGVVPAALIAGARWPPARRRAAIESLVGAERVFAFAHDEPEDSAARAAVRTRAHREADGSYLLDGGKCVVAGGAIADAFLVSACIDETGGEPGGIALFLVERAAPGVHCQDFRAIDGQPLGDLILRGARVAADAMLMPAGTASEAIGAARDRAVALLCVDAVGAMEEALWITIDYLSTRNQFGSPLSEFQALRHRVADMYAEVAMARAAAARAIAALDATSARRARAVSAAKVRVACAGAQVGAQAIQLHGGIGMTEECLIGHFYKRLFAFERMWGNTAEHCERFASLR